MVIIQNCKLFFIENKNGFHLYNLANRIKLNVMAVYFLIKRLSVRKVYFISGFFYPMIMIDFP